MPENEAERLAALRRYDILDSETERSYDDLVRLAAQMAGTPVAMISLIDEDRQWFKSKIGVDVRETSRDAAFCAHAILQPDRTLVIRDAALDPRFSAHPAVTDGPRLRFYAGAPLVTADRHVLGTLCVADRQPREFEPSHEVALQALSRQVVALLEWRRTAAELRKAIADRETQHVQLQNYRKALEQGRIDLQRASLTDALTGIGNRAAFDLTLNQEVYRARRYGNPLSLLLIDVDYFKEFNDSWGHPAGDMALLQVAGLLRRRARPSDFVARYGGEEFVVVLPDTDGDGAVQAGEAMRAAVEQVAISNHRVTISVGAATLLDTMSAEALVESADQALYQAKRGGRNRVVRA